MPRRTICSPLVSPERTSTAPWCVAPVRISRKRATSSRPTTYTLELAPLDHGLTGDLESLPPPGGDPGAAKEAGSQLRRGGKVESHQGGASGLVGSGDDLTDAAAPETPAPSTATRNDWPRLRLQPWESGTAISSQ